MGPVEPGRPEVQLLTIHLNPMEEIFQNSKHQVFGTIIVLLYQKAFTMFYLLLHIQVTSGR